jgi:putative ABC transport system ATP-binding protein
VNGGAPAVLRVDAVSKEYDSPAGVVCALDGVSFAVEAGISVAITGPSGSGKSTLLAIMGGLEAPTTGRITVVGQELSAMSDAGRAGLRRNDIGLVYQADNLLPFLTAVENVGFQLSLHGATAGYERCLDLLCAVGLADGVAKLPDQLSRGERQRVAVARALVHEPRVVLADEPTGSLDPDSSAVLVQLLREAAATLVVVTHDPWVAAQMDRTLRLRDGRLVDDA